MENSGLPFNITVKLEDNFVLLLASGKYSLLNANNLFQISIDSALSNNKSKILIDVTDVTGNIPFFDRFQFSEFFAEYKAKHAFREVNKIAVVGQEPIVHDGKFGETVAVNRGLNVRVYTNMNEAMAWLTNT